MLNGGNGAVRQRMNFSKIPTVIKIPNLIEVQGGLTNDFFR